MDAYRDGVRRAYVGELTGDLLYRRLSIEHAHAACRGKLAMIADVERRTHQALQPVARRLGIRIDQAEIREAVERRAADMRSIPWPDMVRHAACAWPAYVAQFEALAQLAPVDDASAMNTLVSHERALVEFAKLEAHAPRDRPLPPSGHSLAPLQQFLREHEG